MQVSVLVALYYMKMLCVQYMYYITRSHYKIIILSKKKKKNNLKVHGRTILVHITSIQQLYAEKKNMLKTGKVLKHSDWVRQSMIIKCWLFFDKTIYHNLKVM